tara:strand:+ start:215 stop:1024 length:810 start_codon:yes stop_codon:yes gene_type:complete
MDVSIIIIHYNTPKITSDCIKSIYQQTIGITYELIVVDNGSTIHDSSELKENFTEIILVKSETNLGFAGGNNLGIQYASGKYILLLNSDTYLKDNAILSLFNYMEEHPEAGVVSPRLIFPDGRHQSVSQRFPSIKYSLIELLRLQKFMPKRKAGKLLLGAFFNHLETIKVDWVWGACFMFPRAVLSQLPDQKLDATYFMYCEDMQWCLDISKLGFEIHFFAEAEIVHVMGGSSGKKSTLMRENGELFLKKNYPEWQIKWIKRLENWLTI